MVRRGADQLMLTRLSGRRWTDRSSGGDGRMSEETDRLQRLQSLPVLRMMAGRQQVIRGSEWQTLQGSKVTRVRMELREDDGVVLRNYNNQPVVG